ncbi:hypothetical protein JG687_00008544 [Phytophthora cactorum]|uniref:Uncharacterized protein n=1 Tax=Phytophthora cactorum TaxID=29920 RepID=A0A8T1UEH2_9STRA|nr:hypothetical protein PC123_g14084 [Phytophthora cactorum]KAG6959833.1 hypothetical protein JG687_00008544 [Phytophthora cactorum]
MRKKLTSAACRGNWGLNDTSDLDQGRSVWDLQCNMRKLQLVAQDIMVTFQISSRAFVASFRAAA